MVCSKCNIDQTTDKFETYYHSTRKNFYTRKICTSCMRKGYNEYKLRIKKEKLLLDIQNNPNYKQCGTCMEYKHITDFYLSHAKNPVKMCKDCYKKYHRGKIDEKISMNGGSSSYYADPNKYFDDEQKEQVFSLMKAFGWIFDKSTGIWNKPGVKENGVFINMVLQNKPKRVSTPGGGRKIKKGVWNNVENIIKLLEQGHSYRDVADTYCCSHTLIRSVVSNYRNGTN